MHASNEALRRTPTKDRTAPPGTRPSAAALIVAATLCAMAAIAGRALALGPGVGRSRPAAVAAERAATAEHVAARRESLAARSAHLLVRMDAAARARSRRAGVGWFYRYAVAPRSAPPVEE